MGGRGKAWSAGPVKRVVCPLAGVPRLRRRLCSLFFLLLSSALCSAAVVAPCSTAPLLSLSPPALPCPFLPCCCARTTGKDGRCCRRALALLRRAAASTAAAPALLPRSALALSHAKRRHRRLPRPACRAWDRRLAMLHRRHALPPRPACFLLAVSLSLFLLLSVLSFSLSEVGARGWEGMRQHRRHPMPSSQPRHSNQ